MSGNYAMSDEQWESLGDLMYALRRRFFLFVECYREKHLPSLPVEQRRRAYDCFVAHGGEQKNDFAEPFRQWLADSGAVEHDERVFVDQPSLEDFGDAAHDMFDAACRARSAVFLASREAVAKPWCMFELCIFAARDLLEEQHGHAKFLLAPLAFAPEGQEALPEGQKPWINALGSLALPWGHHHGDSAAKTMPNVIGSIAERQALLREKCASGAVLHKFLRGSGEGDPDLKSSASLDGSMSMGASASGVKRGAPPAEQAETPDQDGGGGASDSSEPETKRARRS